MNTKLSFIAAAVLTSSCFAQTAVADSNAEVLQYIESLVQRIEALESQLKDKQGNIATVNGSTSNVANTTTSTPTILTSEDGTLRVSPSTTVKFGGYLQADMMYDLRYKNGEYFNPGNTPDSSIDDQPHTLFQARQSRLNMLTTTDVGTGTPLQTFFEIDFMGSLGNEVMGNSHDPRLRSGYVKYGRYMAGQDWSNFQDSVGYPVLLDLASPAGRVFVRQTQFRVSLGNFSFSLENPETQAVSGASIQAESLGGIGRDRLPDFTAAWRGGPGGAAGSYQLSALLRKLSVEGNVNGIDYDESKTGWGLNAAGRWDIGAATFKANAVYGDGVGRYINMGWANDMRLNTDGSADVITSWGASVAMEYGWTPRTASTFSYGHFSNEDDYAAFGTEHVDTYRANYRWYPVDTLMLGGELMYATRDFVDGRNGDNTRLQFSVRKSF